VQHDRRAREPEGEKDPCCIKLCDRCRERIDQKPDSEQTDAGNKYPAPAKPVRRCPDETDQQDHDGFLHKTKCADQRSLAVFRHMQHFLQQVGLHEVVEREQADQGEAAEQQHGGVARAYTRRQPERPQPGSRAIRLRTDIHGRHLPPGEVICSVRILTPEFSRGRSGDQPELDR